MSGRYLVACAVVVAGACSSRPKPVPPPSNTTVASTPPPIATCEGSDQRRYGTTCCDVRGAGDEDKFPGMVFLSCEGPQIGTPCTKKADCDVACSCDNDAPLDPRNGPQGPPDGTPGVTGRCAGELAIGVWMCQIDESGAVSHVIVD